VVNVLRVRWWHVLIALAVGGAGVAIAVRLLSPPPQPPPELYD
jgi:hypothetical protein